MSNNIKQLVSSVEEYDEVKPWCGTLLLENISVESTEDGSIVHLKEKVDVFQISNYNSLIYYDRNKYKNESDWERVVNDIKLACVECNYHVVLNGSFKKKRHNDFKEIKIKRFRCCHYRPYLGDKNTNQDPRLEQKGRKRSLVGDRKNQRTGGKSFPRLTTTGRNDHQCSFGFGVYFDSSGFVILKPGLESMNHSGHRPIPTNEMVLKRGEISKEMEKRMIEDAGSAISISTTQRVMNMSQFATGPYVKHSTIRKFRASHILKSAVDGSIVRLGKHKSDMDLILELLEKNKARVTYLSMKTSSLNESEIVTSPQKQEEVLIASRPVDQDNNTLGTFIAQTSRRRIGLVVEKGNDKYLEIVNVESTSPLRELVKQGDKIMSVNGKDMFDITLGEFVDYMHDIQGEYKSFRIWRSDNDSKHASISNIENVTEEKVNCQELYTVNGNRKVFTDAMLDELKKTAYKYRQECLPQNEDYEIFLGIAWLCSGNWNAGLMFGKTLMIDTTFNVCVFSNFRQMSIVYKNTEGEAFTLCRIGIPHERAFLCSWCLEVVVPALMTKLFAGRVRTIISDGCQWLIQSIETSLSTTYINARRLRCGWHITSKNWEENIQRYLVFHDSCSLENKRRFPKFVCNWIYSWMKTTCDSKAEYEISKELLLSWLVSDEVITHICPVEVSKMIITWLQTSVFPYETDYAFYIRRTDENMENSTCCPIEGTHNALKNNGNKVQRTDTLPIYVKKAIDYDMMRLKKVQTIMAERREKTNLFGYDWASHLCNKGALLTFNITQWSEHYLSQYLGCVDGLPEFVVLCDANKDEDSHLLNENTIESKECADTDDVDQIHGESYTLPRSYPKYRHPWKVRVVRINEEFSLVCNCMMLRRVGIPCPHLHHVLKYHLNEWFFGIDWFDYKTEWWRITYTLCYKPPNNFTGEERILLDKLLDLADNDSRVGVQLRPKNDSNIDSSILKHEWEGSKQMGMNVENGDTLEPREVVKKSAESRLKNWKLRKSETSDRILESSVIDYSEDIERKTLVSSSITQQRCKKDILDLVYDICEKVEFSEHPEYFDKLRKSLDKLHTESIDLVMNGSESNASSLSTTFAAAARHGQEPTTTNRLHSFHTKSERVKKVKGKLNNANTLRRGKKVFNITSP